jgi:hypothetical protein
MTSMDSAQMKVLMGPGIFHLTVKPAHEMGRSDLITLLAINPQVKQALNSMMAETGGKCPLAQNPYPKDPVLGDVKWCVNNFELFVIFWKLLWELIFFKDYKSLK